MAESYQAGIANWDRLLECAYEFAGVPRYPGVGYDAEQVLEDGYRLAAGRTVRGWEKGHGPLGEAPPAGWESLSVAVLFQYVRRHDGREEARRRAGASAQDAVIISGTCLRWGTPEVVALTGSGDVVTVETSSLSVSEERLKEGVLVSLPPFPSPGGWWEAAPHDDKSYRALRLVQEAPRGLLDVTDALPLWGRHEKEGWGRFLLTAYRGHTAVGADEALWPLLDALSRLQREGILPEGAGWIRGSARITSNGKLHISSHPASSPVVLVHVGGHESSRGRWGRSGYCPTVKQGCSAARAEVFSSSRGGGQAGAAVLAAVSEGRPLLLTDGVGYALRGRTVERVPGLAAGTPIPG
ncbi:MAG TPA: hypothetical protein VEI97_14500 [bacterium]|nr:hypothetical protein [bacterium]